MFNNNEVNLVNKKKKIILDSSIQKSKLLTQQTILKNIYRTFFLLQQCLYIALILNETKTNQWKQARHILCLFNVIIVERYFKKVLCIKSLHLYLNYAIYIKNGLISF